MKQVLLSLTLIIFLASCSENSNQNKISCEQIKDKCMNLIKENLNEIASLITTEVYEEKDVKQAFKSLYFFEELEKLENQLEQNCPIVNEKYEEELKKYLTSIAIDYIFEN